MLRILKEKKKVESRRSFQVIFQVTVMKNAEYCDKDLLVAVSNSHAVAPFIIAKAPRCLTAP